MKTPSSRPRRTAGFSLVELLISIVIGLVIMVSVISVYLATKTGLGRQKQLSSIQQNVRDAFDYLTHDARQVGNLGCQTGRASGFSNSLSSTDIASNYALGVEGYEYDVSSSAYTLTSNSPSDVSTAANWKTNTTGITTIPVSALSSGGLTPGSDVLVIRTIAGPAARLSADTTVSATSFTIENKASGKCRDGTTDRISGLCTNSHVLIADCKQAQALPVSSISTTSVTVGAPLSATAPYTAGTTEVFPMQTATYYVKAASSGNGASLYRRVFTGDKPAASSTDDGIEQELIENIEMMQVTYGYDNTTPDPDGVVDAYKIASDVADWSRVVAVRMSLLVRATDPLPGDSSVAASGIVNDVTVTYPSSGRKYDRRVFTTTVAVRNRISYF